MGMERKNKKRKDKENERERNGLFLCPLRPELSKVVGDFFSFLDSSNFQ